MPPPPKGGTQPRVDQVPPNGGGNGMTDDKLMRALGWASAGLGVPVLLTLLRRALTRSRPKTVADLSATTTVHCPPQQAYDRWRQLESLPTFMAHLDEVRATGQATSHWRASARLAGPSSGTRASPA